MCHFISFYFLLLSCQNKIVWKEGMSRGGMMKWMKDVANSFVSQFLQGVSNSNFLTLNNVRLDIDISLNTTKSQSLTDVSVVRLATQMRLPLSVGTSTASYYRSAEKTHLQGGYPFDYDGVCERLRWRPCFTSKGQAKMLAHTLKHSLHSQGLPELRRDQELSPHILHQGDALKALSTKVGSRKSKLKRGGVSAVMLKMNSK